MTGIDGQAPQSYASINVRGEIPGDSDEIHFYTTRILTWPYRVILTFGIMSLNFITKVGLDHGKCR